MEQGITEKQFKEEKLREDDKGLWLFDKCIMFKEEYPFIIKGVELICKKIKPKKVLELGFGYGWTSTQFQKCGVKEHTIVEAHPVIFKRAEKWRKKYPNKKINLINKFVQDFKYDEKDYDLIYDDRDELVEELEAGTTFPNWKIIK